MSLAEYTSECTGLFVPRNILEYHACNRVYVKQADLCPLSLQSVVRELPADTVNLYGSSDQVLPFTSNSKLYVFPSMNFSCDGTITDIRMRMNLKPGLPPGGSITQEVVVYLLLFHDGLNSPTRRVSHILLNQNNTQQESPNEIWRNSDPLSLPVTEGTFIGFAVPEMKSPTVFSKDINSVPTTEKVEAFWYEQLATNFNELEVLEVAKTGDVCQFTTEMFALPLIAVTFSKYTLCMNGLLDMDYTALYAHSTSESSS